LGQYKNLNDEELLSLLDKKDNQSTNIAFREIYRQVYPMVKRMVIDHGGSEEEAFDIFQDTALIFFNKVSNDQYTKTSSISTYLYAIARNQWYYYIRRNKHVINSQDLEGVEAVEITENESDKLSIAKIMEKLLDQLDQDCRNLLTMFYYQNKSMKLIKEAFNLGSVQAAKVKKFRCVKRLKQLFNAKRINKDSFI